MLGRNITGFMSIIAVGLMAASTSAVAGGERLRLECKASSTTGDSSMDAKYEKKGNRMKFSASFESVIGEDLQEDDSFKVTVEGKHVGYITLAVQEENGDLGGDLDFDSNIDRDDPDDTTVPFPENFPDVKATTVVYVGTLGCSLNDR